MNSLKTKATAFALIAIQTTILCLCCGYTAISQSDTKAVSMKIRGDRFFKLKDYDLVVITLDRKFISERYKAIGKISPDSTPKKIKLRTAGDPLPTTGVKFRTLVLSKKSITDFITDLLNSADHIDLGSAEGTDYFIVFTPCKETDASGSYINYSIQARKKNSKSLYAAKARPNPCPPCTY
jgi:hypothetical protein